MLFVILACSIIGMLLLYRLGLSDATQRDTKTEHISGEHRLAHWTQRSKALLSHKEIIS